MSILSKLFLVSFLARTPEVLQLDPVEEVQNKVVSTVAQTRLRSNSVELKGTEGRYGFKDWWRTFCTRVRILFKSEFIPLIKGPTSQEIEQLFFYRQCDKVVGAYQQYRAYPSPQSKQQLKQSYDDLILMSTYRYADGNQIQKRENSEAYQQAAIDALCQELPISKEEFLQVMRGIAAEGIGWKQFDRCFQLAVHSYPEEYRSSMGCFFQIDRRGGPILLSRFSELTAFLNQGYGPAHEVRHSLIEEAARAPESKNEAGLLLQDLKGKVEEISEQRFDPKDALDFFRNAIEDLLNSDLSITPENLAKISYLGIPLMACVKDPGFISKLQQLRSEVLKWHDLNDNFAAYRTQLAALRSQEAGEIEFLLFKLGDLQDVTGADLPVELASKMAELKQADTEIARREEEHRQQLAAIENHPDVKRSQEEISRIGREMERLQELKGQRKLMFGRMLELNVQIGELEFELGNYRRLLNLIERKRVLQDLLQENDNDDYGNTVTLNLLKSENRFALRSMPEIKSLQAEISYEREAARKGNRELEAIEREIVQLKSKIRPVQSVEEGGIDGWEHLATEEEIVAYVQNAPELARLNEKLLERDELRRRIEETDLETIDQHLRRQLFIARSYHERTRDNLEQDCHRWIESARAKHRAKQSETFHFRNREEFLQFAQRHQGRGQASNPVRQAIVKAVNYAERLPFIRREITHIQEQMRLTAESKESLVQSLKIQHMTVGPRQWDLDLGNNLGAKISANDIFNPATQAGIASLFQKQMRKANRLQLTKSLEVIEAVYRKLAEINKDEMKNKLMPRFIAEGTLHLLFKPNGGAESIVWWNPYEDKAVEAHALIDRLASLDA
jgi:hypothetical protein